MKRYNKINTNEYRSEVIQRMDIDNLLDLLEVHIESYGGNYTEFNKRCSEDIKNEIKRRVKQ